MSATTDHMNDDSIHQLRIPPHSIEAEQAVIGGCIISAGAYDRVAGIIGESDFYRADHQILWRAIESCVSADQPTDVVTLAARLSASGELEQAGDMVYLGTLAKDTPSAANVVTYAKIVRGKSLLRQYIHASEKNIESAMSFDPRSAEEIIDDGQGRLMVLLDHHSVGEPAQAGTVLPSVIDDLDQRFNNGGQITGLRTGFEKIDEQILGLQPSDLIIVAGRPSQGKTSFVMNIAEHVSVRDGHAVAVFSLEMSSKRLMNRSICSIGRIQFDRFRRGQLQEHDWPRVTSATSHLRDAPLYIDDTSALKVSQIRARARRLKKMYGIKLVIVDYMQLMTPSNSRAQRVDQVSEISQGMKQIAKELDVAVIALSQLNRSLENRSIDHRRPVMSDLRDSGSIEQDADIIYFVYRDEVYKPDTERAGIAELICAKNRDGEIGTVFLKSNLHMVRFDTLTGEVPAVNREHQQKPTGGLD